jgi:NAD-dependent SIR2 family protein deacetylase
MEIRLKLARPLKMYTVENLINEITAKKIRKIVVLTGAGISTPSGNFTDL